ncbi:tyrosine-type recombinase/integrase [Flavihumibacter petaseus]|uniref:Tyrosine recombinase XerC n=1 Tax=Flavihumibacter petaseus NBRC 106054 TaxID=1220578 RepID=A0A0E9MVN6_9BACT|nr:tyrosine-type recombinase/integrase [Flavihumibacter petaseus]GAO41190.1 tyrosine recombinase XerC [Flavihumibacter petaseus NBRC 106054]
MSVTEDLFIADFLRYLQWEKRYSQHTVNAYKVDLETFREYLVKEYETAQWEAVTTFMARSWLSSMREGSDPYENRSIARKLSSLRSFYKYLMRKKAVKTSPVAVITAPKSGRKLPVYVEENQAAVLMQQMPAGGDWKSRTTILIVDLFYQTGIRLSELINLRKSQVDYYAKHLRVLGKGNKERIIPLHADMLTAIKAYEAEKAVQGWEQADQEYLLLTEKGKQLYSKYVYNIVNQLLKENEATRHLAKKSPHILRHTFATHLLNQGAELNAVKELLGHSSLAATQVYTHNTIGKLKDVHKKAHPKG